MTALTVADTGLRLLAFTDSDIAQVRATARIEVAVGAAIEAACAARKAVTCITGNAASCDPALLELRELGSLARRFRALADQLDAAAASVTLNLHEAA